MIGVDTFFTVLLSKGVENYSKKINLLKREWVFFMPFIEQTARLQKRKRRSRDYPLFHNVISRSLRSKYNVDNQTIKNKKGIK